MGRHEPLTSLALGRSPYDAVFEGEGEADPQEPPREYDQHGRVVNEASKQLNKNIIRAHNEVMLVIGVAEQEPSGPSYSTSESTRLYTEDQNRKGGYFLHLGRVLVVAGIWGVHGVRQRILVYRETAGLPFLDLIRREGRTHTIPRLLFAGMPSFFTAWSLQWCSKRLRAFRNNIWYRAAVSHIRFHLQIYVSMQRLDLIPGSRWFPDPAFFIPFSSASPFTAPPLPSSLSARSLFEWAGELAINLAPYAGYYLVGCAWELCSHFIRKKIHRSLPHPRSNSTANLRVLAPTSTPRRQSFPESPTLGDGDREIRQTLDPEADTDYSAANGDGVSEPLHVETIHRQGTFSSRGGDDYATDEEDTEMVNPTLISFDVDTSETTEPPAGIWSAELRPSNSGDPRAQQKEPPRYVVNTLTNLPSILAGDILTSSLTHICLVPIDILAFRKMARTYSIQSGLPTSQIFESSLADGLTTRTMVNLFQVEVVKFIISFGAWAIITGVAQKYQITDEQWKENQLKMERAVAEDDDQVSATGTAQAS
ncbi:hypothetical protein SAMD00023353_0601170 [Rosellinia necatrix]|uniref:Uncharacterized protein n=1 Tax=Rosellinia necatrix TaxID=77044 RepID=A0A1S7UP15_ROSNE|nr:hypothetical protein SAMD00023353_0601170 [Rosellinia necatrix]